MSVPRLRTLLLAGAAALVTGIILLLPARVVYHWTAPPAMKAAGIDGSLWNGTAREILIDGVYVRDLRWRMRPLQLFLARLAWRVDAQPVNGFFEGNVAIGIDGSVALSKLNAALPLSTMQAALPMQDVSGELTVQLEDVQLEDGWPRRLSGRAGLSNLLVRAMAPTPLGSFSADFRNVDDAIVGSVEDTGGMLDVAGTLTLRPDRSYSLTGQVGATATATPTVEQQLRFLGTANDRGLREFRLEGVL
ncbi:MAG: type II secretion system protein N [Woeseiaceae bacterium]|nr:type II secretion system protein N [Woeseiaceae bacterium]